MKKKLKRAFVGDVIITNKNFKPKNKSGDNVYIGVEQYRGMIVNRRGTYYGIRFGEGLDFTNKLNGLLSKPVGAMLERNEFDIDTTV